jgi:cellulose synthase/poly-beta-1,6-N-acetylglucosamine synthase-like glycosyltransferase
MDRPHKPCISVIIPHLNEPIDLQRCLASLGDQIACPPFEVIVVDNGSRELPTTICEDVRLESESIPGPGPARNRGACVAKAPILAFIDADCIADSRWLSELSQFFVRNPLIDYVAGDIRIARRKPDAATALEAYEEIYSYRVPLYVQRHHFATAGNMAVRTKTFREVGPFGGIDMMEDDDWGRRAKASGVKIAFVPQARVYTPSCKSYPELIRRWDRHIAHAFRDVDQEPMPRARWILRSLAIAISPPAEIVRIARSNRIAGPRQRLGAFAYLTRVRLYRARKMLNLALGRESWSVKRWNRE